MNLQQKCVWLEGKKNVCEKNLFQGRGICIRRHKEQSRLVLLLEFHRNSCRNSWWIPKDSDWKWPLQTLKIGLIFDHKNEIYIYIFFLKKDKISIIFGFCTRIRPIFRRIYISHLIIKVQNSLVCMYHDFELSLSLTP